MQRAKAAVDLEDCQPPQLQNASKLAAGGNSNIDHSRYVAGCLSCELKVECYILSQLHYVCLLQLADLLRLHCSGSVQFLDE